MADDIISKQAAWRKSTDKKERERPRKRTKSLRNFVFLRRGKLKDKRDKT